MSLSERSTVSRCRWRSRTSVQSAIISAVRRYARQVSSILFDTGLQVADRLRNSHLLATTDVYSELSHRTLSVERNARNDIRLI
jgi:hypothetical protein